jgi:hypothetical protein
MRSITSPIYLYSVLLEMMEIQRINSSTSELVGLNHISRAYLKYKLDYKSCNSLVIYIYIDIFIYIHTLVSLINYIYTPVILVKGHKRAKQLRKDGTPTWWC